MYLDYIKERYHESDFAPLSFEQVAEAYEKFQQQSGTKIITTKHGFMTYKAEGDAAIIYDIYIKPESRRNNEGTSFAQNLERAARNAGLRVLITFSEFGGKNRELGINAMKAFGFQPAYNLGDVEMFIKGI